jgi:hypothetical protein
VKRPLADVHAAMTVPVPVVSAVQVTRRRLARSRACRSRSQRLSVRDISRGQLPSRNPGVARILSMLAVQARNRPRCAAVRAGPAGSPYEPVGHCEVFRNELLIAGRVILAACGSDTPAHRRARLSASRPPKRSGWRVMMQAALSRVAANRASAASVKVAVVGAAMPAF